MKNKKKEYDALIFLALKIKELRKERKMTQQKLALLLGVTQKTISAYECMRYPPSTPVLFKLADVFQVSTDYLTGLSPVRNVELENAALAEPLTQYLLLCHQRLGDQNKDRLLSFCKELLEIQESSKSLDSLF